MKTPLPPPGAPSRLRRAFRQAVLLAPLAAVALTATAQSTVIDNTGPSGFEPWPTASGSFVSADSPSGFTGSNYFHDNNQNKGNRSANFRPNLTAGHYEVRVRWPQSSTHAAHVPVDIISQEGTSTIYVNQQITGTSGWNSLGVFPFATGNSGYVRIRNAGTSGRVIWDSVEFVPVPHTDILLQSGSAPKVGSWFSAGGLNQHNSDFHHDGTDKSTVKTITFTPSLPAAGLYEVLVWYPSASNHANNTPFRLHTSGGVIEYTVDQTKNGGEWRSFGVHSFAPGQGHKLVISNEGTAAGKRVVADAVRFRQQHPVERIVDNTDTISAVRTGGWTTSDAVAGFYGRNFLHDGNSSKGAKSVKFTPDLPVTGIYEVFARWPNNQTSVPRATNTPIIIDWAGGVTTRVVNQQQGGGSWQSLGSFNFVHGRVGSVTISNADTNGHVLADAVRFVLTTADWQPEHLGDQNWLEWRAEDLPNGAVSSWTSRVGNVSATDKGNSGQRPTKQVVDGRSEVFFPAGGADRLLFPEQQHARLDHRGIAIVFKIDLSTTTENDGGIFTVNGYGGNTNRQPAIRYNKGTNSVSVTWQTPGPQNGSPSAPNGVSFPLANTPDPTGWHTLVSRRVGKYHYASLDGRDANGNLGETRIEMVDWALPHPQNSPEGYLGDHRSNNPAFAIDSVIITHGVMSSDTAQRLAGWGMWRRGVQANLPVGHPFRTLSPKVAPSDYHFVESTPEEFTALSNYLDPNGGVRANLGDPIGDKLNGWQTVFFEDFTTHNVTDDIRGQGTWFAPGHPAATGVASAVRPVHNANNPTVGHPGSPQTYVHSTSGTGSMKIVMQNTQPSNIWNWSSGSFASVNSNGYGRTWMYPYVEARMKMSYTGTRKGAWPALWLKSINYYLNRTETNVEYDIYEGYISDINDNYHHVIHNWGATGRKMPGRFPEKVRRKSHIKKLEQPHWPAAEELFDGNYHTYATLVTPDRIYTYFDGKEVGSHPTPIEMHQPLWILVDLAMKGITDPEHKDYPGEVGTASGVYTLEVDYIKVMQHPNNPGYKPGSPLGP